MDTQYYCRGQLLKGPPGFLWLFICMNGNKHEYVWRNCMSCVVTKGDSALLMICGYITGLKAGAEFKCSSNISFYLYPQTLAEINELRQVWGGRCYEQFLPDIGKRVCARHSTLSLPVADRPSRLGSRRPLKKIQCRHQRESRCVIILNLNYPAGWKCERQPYLSGVGRRCFILCVQWVPPLTRWD